MLKLTVSGVAADMVVGHEGTDDDAQGSEDEKRNGEGDLLDGWLVGRRVRCLHHHDVLIRDRECVIYVHFFTISLSLFLPVFYNFVLVRRLCLFFELQIQLRFSMSDNIMNTRCACRLNSALFCFALFPSFTFQNQNAIGYVLSLSLLTTED